MSGQRAPGGDYRPRRPVNPPVAIRVFPDRIWPPPLGWGVATPLWQRAAGLRLSEPVDGELTELVVTQAGELLVRLVFRVTLDNAPHTETMLLPVTNLWEPATEAERRRLQSAVADFGIHRPIPASTPRS